MVSCMCGADFFEEGVTLTQDDFDWARIGEDLGVKGAADAFEELERSLAQGIIFGTAATKNVDVPGGVVSFEKAARAGHTAAPDADYAATNTDVQIGFATLTASRTVTLPDVDTYSLGQVLFVADESGQCSEATKITIVPGMGSGDTIAGKFSHTLTSPYQGQGFRRGAANLWIFA